MNRNVDERLIEIYENYIDLGADLLMLEAVTQGEPHCACEESFTTCLYRLLDYIEQHSETIYQLSQFYVKRHALPETRYIGTAKSSRAAAARAASAVWSKKRGRSRGRAALHLRACPKIPRKTAGS